MKLLTAGRVLIFKMFLLKILTGAGLGRVVLTLGGDYRCESDRVKIKGQGAGSRPNVESAGTATLHRQHLQGARAEPAEEVRRLTRTHGEPLRPLWLGARAAGPLVALLTASRALVWQENEPQLRPRAAARQGLVRRPAASRPFTGSRRCRGSSWSSLQASWSRGRRDLKMTFQTTPTEACGPTW